MSSILDLCSSFPVVKVEDGTVVMTEGKKSGKLWIMRHGTVQITKDGQPINTVSAPGAIFGELSFLLDVPHTATVVAVHDSYFHVISHPDELFQAQPAAYKHLSIMLANRIRSLTEHLVELKSQIEPQDLSPELEELFKFIGEA